MKKLLTLFVVLIATCALWASNVITYRASSKLTETTSSSSSGLHTNAFNVSILSHTFSNGTGTITFSGEVTSIGDRAFYYCSGLTSVTIPSSVTSIGGWAFEGCKGLTSITIPNSVTSIGQSAFSGCSGLTSITIPSSVTSIVSGAFAYCSKLTSIVVKSGNSKYDSRGNCNAIIETASNRLIAGCKNTIIPSSVTIIEDYAFSGCSGLTSVTIPDSVTSIGERAFSSCSGLTSITIPNSVSSIGESAFYNCSSLTSITIPDSVTSIEKNAFSGCTGLTSITIPNSVTSIGGGAFSGCTGLTSITISNSVTSIGNKAFYDCSGLKSVHISDITAWCGIAFGDDTANPLHYAHHLYLNGTEITDLVIPNSVTSIRNYAFYYCSGLTSVTIPNSVTSIGDYAFYKCSSLTSVTIGNSVTSIGEYAFYNCSGLTSITIPNSVTSIGYEAFYYCSHLKTVYNLSTLDFVKGSHDYGCVAYYANNVYSLETFSVTSSDTLLGTVGVTLDGRTIPNDTTLWTGTNLTLLATPNEHYQFSRWNDGNRNNPRTITTSKNGTYIAYFEFETHVINLSTSSNGGKVLGKTSGKYLDTISIEAAPDYGYHFTQWSDGVTDNPRSFVLTKDTAFVAAFERNSYSVATTPSDSTMGMTSGDTTALYQDTVTILAIPNYGYHFSRWNDRNTNNPRLITVTKNETYTAYFEPNTYVIHLSTSSNGGKVSGKTSGKYLDTISIEATPDLGYHFTQWNDGNAENPRRFVLTQDTAFAAAFAISYSGSCGNDIDWKYSDGILTISGYGAMYDYSSNTAPWLLLRDSITSLTISEGVTSIGDYAFYGCTSLKSATIGNSVSSIGDKAFYSCKRLAKVTCFANTPPTAQATSFQYYDCDLFVPCDELLTYKRDEVFGQFANIQCISAEQGSVVTTVTVTPSDNSADIVWPKDDAADTYTIVITKDGTTICTLTFNSNGQLMNIAFAPSRDGESPARVAESINGSWSFTVTSLDPATTYAYAVTTKNAAQSVLNTYTGNFTTTGATGLDAVNTGVDTPTKFLRDGQILILRGNTTYNLRGQVVK